MKIRLTEDIADFIAILIPIMIFLILLSYGYYEGPPLLSANYYKNIQDVSDPLVKNWINKVGDKEGIYIAKTSLNDYKKMNEKSYLFSKAYFQENKEIYYLFFNKYKVSFDIDIESRQRKIEIKIYRKIYDPEYKKLHRFVTKDLYFIIINDGKNRDEVPAPSIVDLTTKS